MSEINIEDVRERMIALACQAAKPYLNKENDFRVSRELEGDICGILWAYGFLKIRCADLDAEIDEDQFQEHLKFFGSMLNFGQTGPTIEFPERLAQELASDLEREWQLDAETAEFLPEFLVPGIAEYRVEMFHNESKHPGRPHVKVTIKGVAVNISLDDEPLPLTPVRNVRGLVGALKVIKKHRQQLLDLWDRTRPDDQRLDQ